MSAVHPPHHFLVENGEIIVGGIPVTRLADRVGSTPFFAYDRQLLTDRVALLRSALPAEVGLSYAIKANPMAAVVQHLSGLVDGFDVASGLELRVALDTPMAPDRVSFAGPGKSVAELTQAVAAGVTVEVESFVEAERLVAVGDRVGQTPRAAVRVNPDFAVKGAGMRMGGGPQQFGVDSEVVPQLVKDLVGAGVDLVGYHVFAGSQNLQAALIAQAQAQTVDLVARLQEETGVLVRSLNLGGGFGIPYTNRDVALDLAAVGEHLAELVAGPIRTQLGAASVSIELGRYLVGECGVYVTSVVDRKESRGHTYLVVDGGMHHQLAASGNFGQAIRRNYPLALGNRMDQSLHEVVSVVGCLCTPLDLLGDRVELPPGRIGDLVVIFQAGAYGLTASPTGFLSHPAPPEVLV